MKLKKIASLALAGVMAVSMLAGCSNGTKDDGSDVDDAITTTATGAAALLNDELSQASKNIVKFTNDSKLNDALAKVTADLSVSNLQDAYLDGASVDDELVAEIAAFKYLNCKEYNDPANKAAVKDKTTYVVVYSVGEGVTDSGAVKAIADDVNNYVEVVPTTGANGSNNYNYTYTGAVSVVSKTFENGLGTSRTVKYVAVTLTQTPAQY